MGSVGVPSATQMPSSGLSQTHSDASRLYGTEMALREKYSRPTEFEGANLSRPEDQAAYNAAPALPAKYSADDVAKDRMNTKQAVIDGIGSQQAVVRTAPITQDEIDYVAQADREKQLASFDAYVQTLIDPRKPGNLQWLMETYPDFVTRRIQQIHDDHDFALRNSLTDAFGINKFEDLMFKYNVDQGIITGPTLKRTGDPADHYEPGALSFWANSKKGDRSSLPFASATYGDQPSSNSNLNPPYRYGNRPFGNVANRMFSSINGAGGFAPRVDPGVGGGLNRTNAELFGLGARNPVTGQ